MGRFRLPPDPCRMLGGKRKTKKQTKPITLFDQVSPQVFNKRLRLQGATRRRKYHAIKIREFMSEDKLERLKASSIVLKGLNGLAFRFYSKRG